MITEVETELGPLDLGNDKKWRHITRREWIREDGTAIAYCGEIFVPLGIPFLSGLNMRKDFCPDCLRKSRGGSK